MNAHKAVEKPNLRIWDVLSKTDPAQTKPFTRGGGFKGTAVKPIWIVKRLTEQFGPCGEGWGIGEPRFDMVHAQNGDSLVYCTVSCWHGERTNILFGVGGDKVAGTNKNGQFTDDEAFKKAFTDAVNNAFKFIGVAADIHMGLFEDNKYLSEVTQEFQTVERQKVPGISKIKERLNAFMRKGNDVAELDEFRALVKANKDDIKTIRDANHEYWTGDGGDEFEGFEKWMARRYDELGNGHSLPYALLVSTLAECETTLELQTWLTKHGDAVEALDGEESRAFTALYEAKETALKQPRVQSVVEAG